MMIPAPHRLGMAGIALAVTTLAAVTTSPAHAQISFVDMFRTGQATQTGDGNSLNLTGYYFTLDLTSTNPGDFSATTATYPGPGSPVTLPATSSTVFHYQTGYYPTQAAMDADFPTGTYTFNTSGGTVGAATTNFNYSADFYPNALPFLTGSDYTALQGANAGSDITVHFNAYTNDPSVNDQLRFFTVFDPVLNTFVVNDAFLPNSTASVTIPANTLQAGRNYIYEIVNSNRVQTASPNTGFNAFLAYDLRTTGAFSTAAAATPEPGTLALLLSSGLGGSLLLRRRRR